jgi:hypothetical protein
MRRTILVLIAGLATLFATAGCTRTPNDQAISTAIKAKMFSDAQVKNANVNVSAKNGKVTLEGDVPSDAARYEAYKIASETPGVSHVEDHMTVQTAEMVPPPAQATPAPAEPTPAPRHRAHRKAARMQAPVAEPPAQSTPVDSQAAVQAAPPPVAAATPPAEPLPRRVTIPSGTRVLVRMIDSIDSQTAQTGQMFRASLESPIPVDDEIAVPQHADVMVRLDEAKSAGRMTGRSELRVELAQIILQGRTYPVVSSIVDRTGASRGKDTAVKTGGGAVLGAIIGAIAGGGKGAAIGSVAGAGAGGAVQVLTHGQQIRIPSETTLDFRLEAPVTVTLYPGAHDGRAQSRPNSLDRPSQQ